MALIIDESFEYRHKKFDQCKRSRPSSFSSTDDYECIQVEIERLDDDQPLIQHAMNTSSSHSYNEHPSLALTPPPCKRRRISSTNSGTSYATSFSPAPFLPLRYTSTPINQTTTVAIAPPAAILPKISQETLHSICKYHGNMVRKFPKKERTPKDQERRNKNTIACRMSRRLKKLEHVAIEEQYKEFSQQTFQIIEQAMRSTAYLHELMKLSEVKREVKNNETLNAKEADIKMEQLEEARPTTSSQLKKRFSIDYLLNNGE